MGCGSSSDCGGCPSQSSGCGGGAPQQPQDLTAQLHELSSVKHVIGVVSGKGGVGKSSVTSLMAITMARKGYKVGILDADITGPSIPKMFGIKEKAYADEIGMYPVKSKGGIDVMSVNLLLENDTDPVLWRGPILGNVVITVYQSLKLDGIIIVTSPQDLVSMIVEKAVKMADLMQVPIIGVVENYSYFHCPDNGKDYQIFGESHIEEILQKYGLLLLNRLPIDPTIADLCDKGDIESIEKTNLEDVSLPE
ncbi:MAG: P-loop NTPase [Veillonella sp.]|nr:P-loop NTPase [Veillonella sp.]